jgi:hypothetical protein
MGSYCRAYRMVTLRQFPEWSEKTENARKENRQLDGVEVEAPRELTENDFLYVQEDLSVTDGIHIDENIIYNDITPEWQAFCHEILKFEVPVYQTQANDTPETETSEASGEALNEGPVS